MKADPHGVLTGTHFLDGDHACCEGALAAGARFAAGYPITPSTEVVERFAARVPTVGGTFIQMEDELAASIALQGGSLGRGQGLHGDVGPGLLTDDGAHRLRRHDGNALRIRRRTARRAVDRTAHTSGAGRHDAGALGIARGLRHHCAVPEFAAGMLRPDHQGVQLCRRIPRSRNVHDGRSGRTHDGKGRDPSRRPDRSLHRASTRTNPSKTIYPTAPTATWCRRWRMRATATIFTSRV